MNEPEPFPEEGLAARRVLAVAPHPDDETIGCGGLLATLAQRGASVTVAVVTDGSASHPNSPTWPREQLAARRREELLQAIACLGLPAESVLFLNIRDSRFPPPGSPAWLAAAEELAARLMKSPPDLALLPWRRDPHADHRAAHSLAHETVTKNHPSCRILEYPVWLGEWGSENDRPEPELWRRFRLDIAGVREAKRRALACHVTQTTRLIDDDPNGFCLSPAFIARATGPCETFFERRG